MVRDQGSCFLELHLPQININRDIRLKRDYGIGELILMIKNEFGLHNIRYTIISVLKNKILDPEKTLKEEGISSGDKLLFLFKEENEYADPLGRVYENEC